MLTAQIWADMPYQDRLARFDELVAKVFPKAPVVATAIERLGISRATFQRYRREPESIPAPVILLLQEWADTEGRDRSLQSLHNVASLLSQVSQELSQVALANAQGLAQPGDDDQPSGSSNP